MVKNMVRKSEKASKIECLWRLCLELDVLRKYSTKVKVLF